MLLLYQLLIKIKTDFNNNEIAGYSPSCNLKRDLLDSAPQRQRL